MSFVGEPTVGCDPRRLDADLGHPTFQQVHEHLRLAMRWSQAIQEERANREWTPAPIIEYGARVWLDAQYIRSTRPVRKLYWKQLGPYMILRPISPYAYEVELST